MLRKVKPKKTAFWQLVPKDLILPAVSALLLVLSFPNFNLEFLAWAAFVPLFFAMEGAGIKKAFFLAYVCGALFWLGAIYWLVHVTSLGMLLLVLYLALYWGLFGLIVSWKGFQRRGLNIFLFPALWVLLEYMRSYFLTGFPWALLGYSQYQTLAIIQIADITGVWGVSFLVMMVNVAVYEYIRQTASKERNNNRASVIFACSLLFCAYAYGVFQLGVFAKAEPPSGTAGAQGRNVRISLIQGNIPQELKWDSSAREYITRRYFSLSQEAAKDKPDLIVWPEAAVPDYLTERSDYFKELQALAQSSKADLLTGAVTSRNNGYYNSAVLFYSGGGVDTYDKIHLVPFGEYIPLRSIFMFLETVVPIGEVTRGSDYKVFRLAEQGPGAALGFSTLICFEDAFPELSRRFVNRGSRLLITVTNDAWYRRTSAAYQHFQASVFRSVENRVPMARCANTGVSAFINADGTIDGIVSDPLGNTLFVAGHLTRDIRLSDRQVTIYTRFGDWFIVACLLIAFAMVLCYNIFPDKRRR
jgi:apolipoprotein N-acyltransferase